MTSSIPARSHWADRLGTWTSAACLVHCLFTPLLLSGSVVMAHFLPSEEKTHRTLAVGVAFLGAVALLRGFRAHRKRRVLALMAGGLGCIGGAAMWGDLLPTHLAEVAVTMLGSVMMISAHRLNHTFCKPETCATDCDH